MHKWFYVFLSVLQLITVRVVAQNNAITFSHLTASEGLSHSTVKCIFQDREGYMWFGTKDGLNRYDGHRFEVYEHDPASKTSISSNIINAITEDTLGNLWIGTSQGLNRFDKRTQTFALFHLGHTYPNGDGDISSICKDQEGTLWLGATEGLYRLEVASQRFTLYQHATSSDHWKNNAIHSVYEDRSGCLWVGTTRGLSQFDRKSGQFTRFAPYTSTTDTLSFPNLVKTICQDKSGVLWVGTVGNGLQQFDRNTRVFKAYLPILSDPKSLSHHSILSLCEDNQSGLWVATAAGGLNRLDTGTGKFTRYQHDATNQQSISTNSLITLYRDRFNVLWIGTYAGGINKVDLLKKKFSHFSHAPANRNSLLDNHVYSLLADRSGDVWVGTTTGFNQWDRASGQYKHYPFRAQPTRNTSAQIIHCLYEDHLATLWLGTGGEGLKNFDPVKKTFGSYLHNPADSGSLPHNYVKTILEDKQGVVWVGTMRGLSQFDRGKKCFITYTYRQGLPFEANHLLEDPSGDLWVASNVGLLRFNTKKKKFGLIAFPDSRVQAPTNRTVECLYMDGAGTIWMSLKVGGLCRFDPKASRFSVVSQPRTLTTTHISAILGDSQGHLWLSTRRNGLIKFNPRTGTIRQYDQADGLQGNEFNRAFCQSPQGELYFGGNNGFNAFEPDSILDNPYAPPVVIRSFRVFDQSRNFSGNQIILPYSDNFFSFGFAALHFAWPEKNRYAYRLEGVDKDWISTESRHEATYTNLDPGEYVLRVKAANNDGVWNEQGTWMKVIITPPWWKTPWAYGLYSLLLLGVLYAFQQYTLSQARLKNKLERKSLEAEKHQELNRLKTQFFTNVSHEFRTPLTLILNPLEDLIVEEAAEPKRREYYQLMYRNAKRLLGLINQLLDLSKLEAGSLTVSPLPGNIIPFIQSNVASFVPMAQRQRIALQVHVMQQVLWVNFDHEKVEKILSNLLSNAFKFTPEGGAVTVNVTWKPKEGPSDSMPRLTIEVSDTGMGIPAEQLDKIFDRFYQIDHSSTRNVEGSGIGLALVKELVELHSGKITVNSQPGEGTCFTVTIPLEEVSGDARTDALVDQHDASLSLSLTEEYAGEEGSSDLSEAWDERTPLLLIVEDNADIRAYLRNTFDQAYRLVEAKDGVEGLSTAASILPDLIISDWMMPKMDGLTFCARVKADERTSHIPIIMLTAKADIQHKLQGLKNGADDYLVKPFHTEELIIRVQNLLTQRQKLRERFGRLFYESPPDHPVPPPQEPKEASLPPEDKLLSAIDAQFLQKLMAVVETQLDNPDLNSSIIERELGLSRIQLYRKLKALTDQAPSDFIRNCRLKKAAELLSQRQFNVSQVAYQVGFTHLSYFTRCFRQAYGMTPSDYLASRTPQA